MVNPALRLRFVKEEAAVCPNDSQKVGIFQET